MPHGMIATGNFRAIHALLGLSLAFVTAATHAFCQDPSTIPTRSVHATDDSSATDSDQTKTIYDKSGLAPTPRPNPYGEIERRRSDKTEEKIETTASKT